MSEGETNKKIEGEAGQRQRRFRFTRRPAGLMVILLLALVIIAAYQVTMGIGTHDRESFFDEVLGIFGIVFLFLIGGVVLGFLLVAFKSWQRRRKGPRRWGDEDDEPDPPVDPAP